MDIFADDPVGAGFKPGMAGIEPVDSILADKGVQSPLEQPPDAGAAMVMQWGLRAGVGFDAVGPENALAVEGPRQAARDHQADAGAGENRLAGGGKFVEPGGAAAGNGEGAGDELAIIGLNGGRAGLI